MTPLGLLYAGISVSRGGGVTAWETCNALLQQMTDNPDVIAATLPGSHLDAQLHRVVDGDHLFRHAVGKSDAQWLRPAWRRLDEGSIPILLSGQDRDVVLSPETWPSVSAGSGRRLRTLDTLYGFGHRPGLIVIEDALSARAILAGGMALLGKHQPSILISLANCPMPDRLVVWQGCSGIIEGLGYEWFDGLLLPCATPERRFETVIANACGVICARQRSDNEEVIDADLFPEAAGDELAFHAVALNDWAAAVRPERTAPGIIPFDDTIPAYGLYPAETDGSGLWWRWSGPTAHIRLTLPLPSAGHWFLRFDILDWGVADDADDLRIFAERQPVFCDRGGATFARFGPIFIPYRTAAGALAVDIVTPPPRRASDSDARRIGVNFRGFSLERQG